MSVKRKLFNFAVNTPPDRLRKIWRNIRFVIDVIITLLYLTYAVLGIIYAPSNDAPSNDATTVYWTVGVCVVISLAVIASDVVLYLLQADADIFRKKILKSVRKILNYVLKLARVVVPLLIAVHGLSQKSGWDIALRVLMSISFVFTASKLIVELYKTIYRAVHKRDYKAKNELAKSRLSKGNNIFMRIQTLLREEYAREDTLGLDNAKIEATDEEAADKRNEEECKKL